MSSIISLLAFRYFIEALFTWQLENTFVQFWLPVYTRTAFVFP